MVYKSLWQPMPNVAWAAVLLPGRVPCACPSPATHLPGVAPSDFFVVVPLAQCHRFFAKSNFGLFMFCSYRGIP